MVPVYCPENVAPKICLEPKRQFQIACGVFLAQRNIVNGATSNTLTPALSRGPIRGHVCKFGAPRTSNPYWFKAINPYYVFPDETINRTFPGISIVSHQRIIFLTVGLTIASSCLMPDESASRKPVLIPKTGMADELAGSRLRRRRQMPRPQPQHLPLIRFQHLEPVPLQIHLVPRCRHFSRNMAHHVVASDKRLNKFIKLHGIPTGGTIKRGAR